MHSARKQRREINMGWIKKDDPLLSEKIAEEFGTPVYVYSEDRIREKAKRLFAAFNKHCKNFRVYYAIKANINPVIIKILDSEGCGADTSNIYEMKLAENINSKNILFTGAYVSTEDLKFAYENKIPINIGEISALDKLLRIGCPDFLSFRVNTGMGKGQYKGVVVGGPEAKFGIPEKDIIDAYKKAKDAGAKRFGIHTMAGSGILDENYFAELVSTLLDVAGKISKELKIQFELVNIGGGLGIPHGRENELDIEKTAENVCNKFNEKVKELRLGDPVLAMEPGKYLIGDAGVLLTRVIAKNESFRSFVGVDASMSTLLRPALYGAKHTIQLISDEVRPLKKVDVVGPVCESTDTFAKDIELPELKENDLLAILDVGAYGYAMSSQYNSFPRCAEVLVCNGKFRLIREKESFEDLIRGVK